jgi:hypothetical protein
MSVHSSSSFSVGNLNIEYSLNLLTKIMHLPLVCNATGCNRNARNLTSLLLIFLKTRSNTRLANDRAILSLLPIGWYLIVEQLVHEIHISTNSTHLDAAGSNIASRLDCADRNWPSSKIISPDYTFAFS